MLLSTEDEIDGEGNLIFIFITPFQNDISSYNTFLSKVFFFPGSNRDKWPWEWVGGFGIGVHQPPRYPVISLVLGGETVLVHVEHSVDTAV